MTKMLSAFAVKKIRQQQKLIWEAARKIADPPVNLVLERGGVPLVAQQVVAIWNRQPARLVNYGNDPTADVMFYRILEDGFDVTKGDRFSLNGERGLITRVVEHRGKIMASGQLSTGNVWPS